MSDKRRILIVDPSRVARAALVKHLRDDFDVREESDGQTAWQTLVLDSSIVAVIACANLERLSGEQLLSQLRQNRLQRLSEMPFFLLISENESEASRNQAKQHGVTDFIVRGMAGDAIRRRIDRLINWDVATDLGEKEQPKPCTAPVAQFLERQALSTHLQEILSNGASPCSIVAFGLTHPEPIASRFGEETLAKIGQRIALLIREKIGRNDQLGRLNSETFLIIAPGTSLSSSTAFAQRVCRSLAAQSIVANRQRLHLEISMGIASLPADSQHAPDALIALAEARLRFARQHPEHSVVSEAQTQKTDNTTELTAKLLENLQQARQLGEAGLQLMPILRLMEQQFHFGLPLKHMETLFRQDARQPHTDHSQ